MDQFELHTDIKKVTCNELRDVFSKIKLKRMDDQYGFSTKFLRTTASSFKRRESSFIRRPT